MIRLTTPTLLLASLLLTLSCKPYYFRENFTNANDFQQYAGVAPANLYLKAHLQDGKVYILTDTWEIDTVQHRVVGEGSLYNVNRRLITSGPVDVSIDSVVIFETNKNLDQVEKDVIGGLSILAGLDVIMSVICLTNPKTCFGSCPTFYINEDDNFHFANAEGFSSAISPSLEYTDIDALNYTTENLDSFSITMKNEALETHSVNEVKLLAVPHVEGEQIFHAPDNSFYRCDQEVHVGQAMAEEGDITDLLSEADRAERFSLADERNLSSQEEIHLTFNRPLHEKDLGLLVSFRQTQMTTYLFYSLMDYMGVHVSDLFAKLETNANPAEILEKSVIGELGGIEIYVWNNNSCEWDWQGELDESGPIAFSHQMLPLSGEFHERELKVKLVLNKGFWQIDRVGLTSIREVVEPILIKPDRIMGQDTEDTEALRRINDPEEYLITMPGSAYRFSFALPDKNKNYELFLQSKGYYLEWMRAGWLENSNLLKLNQMIKHPKKYLKAEAKAYKLQEKYMEEAFWNSKIDTHSFTYHDH